MEEPNSNNNIDHFQPDPLLKPGAFIDPTPQSNGNSSTVDPVVVEPPPPSPPSQISDQKGKGVTPNGKPKPVKTNAAVDASQSSDQTVLPRPDWLPPDWHVEERIRLSGASAGSRDKYYRQLTTNRRFRSKKEVLYYLETGSSLKRKNTDDADGSSMTESSTHKRKKSESQAKVSLKNFNFDEVPTKVKWVLTDMFEGTWRPLTNGVERVPESAKQEWTAAFTYLTLQTGGKGAFI